MKHLAFFFSLLTLLVAGPALAQPQYPGNLAVLRIGNGSETLANKGNSLWIDQFTNLTTAVSNGAVLVNSVQIPTNGLAPLTVSGVAATEGGLTRSLDHTVLTISGYVTNAGKSSASLSGTTTIPRGIATIDINGNYTLQLSSTNLYPGANPRAAATDGTNNYWTAGGAAGTIYAFQPNGTNSGTNSITVIQSAVGNTRYVRLFNTGVVPNLYFSVQSGGSFGVLELPGLPATAETASAFITAPSGGAESDFAINPAGTTAYLADIVLGFVKYTNNGAAWFAAQTNGIGNPGFGVFSVAVDWSGPNPILYGATTEGTSGNVNGNRIVALVDTGVNATVTTLATATSKEAFRGLDFTADQLPIVLTEPQSEALLAGQTTNLTVQAASPYALGYYWRQNGTNIPGAVGATYNITSAAPTNAGNYTVVITNQYAAVTSAVAVVTVSSSVQFPVITLEPSSQTNIVGSTIFLTVGATGANLSYTWTYEGTPLVDGGEYINSATPTLEISPALEFDAGYYYCIVSNSAGPTNSSFAYVTLVAVPPAITNEPSPSGALVGGSVTLSVGVTGTDTGIDPLLYQWTLNGTNLVDGAIFSGSTQPTLAISPAQVTNTGVYELNITNDAGFTNSQPVTVTVIQPPPASYISYSNLASVYTQNFDSLPNPGPASVSSANPVTIDGITYSLSTPFDFAFPVVPAGQVGGLGISQLAGWYGLAAPVPATTVGARFGASDGDQTTGGDISFGANGASGSNRALGLLDTSGVLYSAFGVKFVNTTTNTLTYFSVACTGELWRDSDLPKTVFFYYYLDPAGPTSVFSTNYTAWVTNLNIAFPAAPADTGGIAVDGTAAANQTNLAALNLTITNGWAPGAALWLTWEMLDDTGKAQGIAIDNLSFAASTQPMYIPVNLAIQASTPGNAVLSWPNGLSAWVLEANSDLTNPGGWADVGQPVVITNAQNTVTVSPSGAPQYYRLHQIIP